MLVDFFEYSIDTYIYIYICMDVFFNLILEKFLTITDHMTKELLWNLKPIVSNPIIQNEKNHNFAI